ncbi:hypothetical protein [Noviherbaspirillum suwonense]|jgi:hypothetical protein|uniref:Restriction endonuclease type IV Mrr domain-containing protein n=1 Tax=Noviherbaspirillum suwonense TaxID=1224511 RepID=A0ABY1Q841_9BURK|nr:hypothetical protein [Noviherbaspirillum suwonense]SMP62357.1 hypothetical protein SAMN06295970_10898 [Noviherbaspirillum suwonense]
MTTTDRVFEILTTEGHYKSLQKPIKIGSQEFDFTHILSATDKGNDLVLVVELTGATDNTSVARSILAFTRALDVFGSRRSVTVVLTSGQADKELMNAINRVCRVLPIGAPSGANATQHVRDWLAVLLPIKSPPPVEHLANWRSALEENLSQVMPQALITQFILQAQNGKDAVEQALAEDIASRADRTLEDGETDQ